MNINKEINLLDYLQNMGGFIYLSDLRRISDTDCGYLKSCIKTVSSEDCSTKEWQDTLEYLAGIRTGETDQAVLKEMLLEASWNN